MATIREWLRSPIHYISSEFIDKFYTLAQKTPSHARLRYIYASLLHKVLTDYLPEHRDEVSLKKYFYAIRSALVLEWLATHTDETAVPPMNFMELLAQTTLDRSVIWEISDLLEKKQSLQNLVLVPDCQMSMILFSSMIPNLIWKLNDFRMESWMPTMRCLD